MWQMVFFYLFGLFAPLCLLLCRGCPSPLLTPDTMRHLRRLIEQAALVYSG